MDSSPLNLLPQDTLHLIISQLTLREIIICKSLCKSLYASLSSPAFLHLLKQPHHSLPLLSLRPSHRQHHHRNHLPTTSLFLHAFNPSTDSWLHFSLSFLPFSSLLPISSSLGLLFLWAHNPSSPSSNNEILVVCNPLTRQYKVLPQLGSAWSRHGSVLVGSQNQVLVLNELAALYFSGNTNNNWLTFPSHLPSKPRSPIMISNVVLALCDVGSAYRPQFKLFRTTVENLSGGGNNVGHRQQQQWSRIERREWGDIFDILKRPRLLPGENDKKVLMIGGLKSSYAIHSACSTIVILRLDLESLEWEEAGRMPVEMFRCFQESSKFKTFGGGSRVCFSAKRVGRLALWEEHGEWRWIENVPGNIDGPCRGFMFDAQLTAVP